MDDYGFWLLVIVLAVISIAGICFACYKSKEMAYGNFQETIKDLDEEQKCLHICGFQYPASTYFDNYKYCVEKCDRISERHSKGCVQ